MANAEGSLLDMSSPGRSIKLQMSPHCEDVYHYASLHDIRVGSSVTNNEAVCGVVVGAERL